MLERQIAELLLEIGAFKFSPDNPFTYASGLKGPIYCDNRLLMAYPKARLEVVEGFRNIIRAQFSDTEAILGMATAGIAHGAWLAHELGLPFGYIRSGPKGHGKGKLIEGPEGKGLKVVIIEDLINQGSSIEKSMTQIKDDHDYLALMSIVDYQMPKAKEVMKRFNFDFWSLTNFEILVDVAREQEIMTIKNVERVLAWHENPKSWSDA